MVSFPYSITICYLGTKGMVPLHWVIGVKTYFFSACSLFSPMIKTQILEVWQGEIASFPTLPSPGYLLFLQENEKKKPQAIWFLEASMCIDPITSKVKLSHKWPHSQHRVSSPSSATFLIISKGFFFFFYSNFHRIYLQCFTYVLPILNWLHGASGFRMMDGSDQKHNWVIVSY